MTGDARTRRVQDTLTIAGSGVIAFGVWSLAKIGLFLTLADEGVLRRLLGIDDTSLVLAVYVLLGGIALIDFGIRTYIGLSARAEGRGGKRGVFYLIVAAIAAIANASSLAAIAASTSFSFSPLSMLVTIVIEATSLAALVLVICSSIRLRRMSKAVG